MLGAQYDGTFRNHSITPDGTLRHSTWFSIRKRSGRRCEQSRGGEFKDWLDLYDHCNTLSSKEAIEPPRQVRKL